MKKPAFFNTLLYQGGQLIWDPCPKLLVQSWTGPEIFIGIC